MTSYCQKILGYSGGEYETCRVCGGSSAPVKDLMTHLKPTYTDHHSSRASASNVLCVACMDVMSGKPPNTLRMVSTMWSPESPQELDVERFGHLSHRVVEGVWMGNKKDSRPLVSAMLGEIPGEWGVGYADSGKLHVIPFVKMNYGSNPWSVRFDRIDVSSSPSEFRDVFRRVNSLIAAGFTRSSIACGEPAVHELVKFGVDCWRDNTTKSWADSPLLLLTLAVSKKEHADESISRLDD